MPPTKQTRRGCRTNGSLEANGNPVGTLFQDSLPCQAGSDWTGRLPRRYADRLAVQVAAAREERSFPRRRKSLHSGQVYRPGTKSRSISLSDVAAIQLSTAPQEDSPL